MEKQLPQNIEAEESVIGAILLDPQSIIRISDFLRPEDFYREAHRMIYEAMLTLNNNRMPAELTLVADELEKNNKLEDIGGFHHLVSLLGYMATSGNIEFHAHIVERTAMLRRLIHAAGRIAALAYEQVPDALQRSEEMLFQISQGNKTNNDIHISESMTRYMEKLDTLYRNRQEGVASGVTTGYTVLDNVLGGLQPSDLITLAARPGIGKTSLALNIALNAMKKDNRILFFSLEMGEEQMMRRLHSMASGIDQTRLRHGALQDAPHDEWALSTDVIGRLSQYKWWADYTAGISLTDMRTRARRAMSEHGIDALIVDYLGLMTAPGSKKYENRVQEISTITRGLKELARELNVPVLMLAQLNRNIEQRADKTPQLSDLRESGSIEQDSDVVMFLSPSEEKEQQERMANRQEYIVEVNIAKQRNGPVGCTQLMFNPILTRFSDLVEEEY